MSLCIDLNADLGEGAGHDSALLGLVTSANLACGLHAGSPLTILRTLQSAHEAGVSVGAHPSLADREGFGRRELPSTPEEIFALVSYQVGAFGALAASVGIHPRHVKPHGALYNMAAREDALADAVVRAVLAFDRSLLLFAPPASALSRSCDRHGLQVVAEFFADREYLADGSLVPRSRPDAVIHDPSQAMERVLRMLRDGMVRTVDGLEIRIQAGTVCLHGDNPEALSFARSLRSGLFAAGISVEAPKSRS